MILGICGGSGAGKTTLLKRLAAHFAQLKPAVFSMDNYYLPLEQQRRDDQGEINFDLPTALEKDRLIADLQTLASGQPIRLHEYLFNTRQEQRPLITIEPSALVIVEGLFLFHYAEVADLVDFSVFIDVDPANQLARRLQRDQLLRDCSEALINYQWHHHVIPCYNQFLLPYRHQADFLFCNEDQADQEFERLVAELTKRTAATKRPDVSPSLKNNRV